MRTGLNKNLVARFSEHVTQTSGSFHAYLDEKGDCQLINDTSIPIELAHVE
jgi:hypothetical protein